MARILIVEDTAALAQGLRSVLQLNGHQVVLAADGRSGLAAARRDQPDLVLLDLMLPDLHGLEVLETLRTESFTMPVLVLTASGETEARERSRELGANGFLPKPFQLGQLLGEVHALLNPPGEALSAASPCNDSPAL
jgi:DNA-binding response OmpR family regulator